MIILDTNVISEPQRKVPEHRVVQWLDEQPLETLFVSTVTVAELRFGVGSLPDGKRRNYLLENLENRIIPAFTGRVLPFDLAATAAYAELMIKARAAGLSIGVADGYIAAIASANNMIVATRDVSPFEAVGLRVINPWEVG
uniref:Ribonuclease VapC n=1 Tax=uncultured Thiotrichaceae bacterium TaxID=298394 RepID=A0A6S6UNI5_9GAMM|nr:MAG: Ribonuclease VapC [uncultured Thiotrichaceae bacterium]